MSYRFASILIPLTACLFVTSGCTLLDPTYGMTQEEKTAYHTRKKAEREEAARQRKIKEAAFRKRSPDNMSSPGEGHNVACNANMAGRWVSHRKAKWVSLFLLKEKLGMREWTEELRLFDNGSYAYRLAKDKRWGKDSKGRDWKMGTEGMDLETVLASGSKVGKVVRGQWKTEPKTVKNPQTGKSVKGEALYFRRDSIGGYRGWAYMGICQLGAGGRNLIVLNEQKLKTQKASLERQQKSKPLKYPAERAAMLLMRNSTGFTRG